MTSIRIKNDRSSHVMRLTLIGSLLLLLRIRIPGHLKSKPRASLVVKGDWRSEDGDDVVRSLAAEPQIGPTEYKLSLVRQGKSAARLEQLTTQLLWRLQQSTSYALPSQLTARTPF